MNKNQYVTGSHYGWGEGESFYCRCECHNSESNLEESRLNMAFRIILVMRGERMTGEKERKISEKEGEKELMSEERI